MLGGGGKLNEVIEKIRSKAQEKQNNNNGLDKYTSTQNAATTSDVLYVEPTLFGTGKLNPFSTRVFRSYLTINSVYRPDYDNTISTDFIVDLPNPLSRVASYELSTFSGLPLLYNVNAESGSNNLTIYIENLPKTIGPPNSTENSSAYIEVESGVYQPADIVNFFNGIFSASSNGLQFLRCDYNTSPKRLIFRAYNFWIDGYLTQIGTNGTTLVYGGGPFDEQIIDRSTGTTLKANPFYSPNCTFTIDFTSLLSPSRPLYKNLGWALGFTGCKYTISMNTYHIFRTNSITTTPTKYYFNFYTYFTTLVPSVFTGAGTLSGYTNNLYLQRMFRLDTSYIDVYGYIQGENTFADITPYPNWGAYMFLEIDDYNKNINSSTTRILGENFDSIGGGNVLAKINLSTAITTINNAPNRIFFGPVDVRKFHVRLLNQYGQVIQLHNDFSFTLHFTQIY